MKAHRALLELSLLGALACGSGGGAEAPPPDPGEVGPFGIGHVNYGNPPRAIARPALRRASGLSGDARPGPRRSRSRTSPRSRTRGEPPFPRLNPS